MYVIAGFSGEERNDVWRHDLATGDWTEVAPREPAAALPARSVFGAAAVGNLLVCVLFEGCRVSGGGATSACPLYAH